MNRQNSKTAPVIKKVAPPTVPDFRHSGSSFGSAGYSSSGEDPFISPADANKDTVPGYDVTDYPSTMPGKSPGAQFNYPAFTFPGPPNQYTQLVHGGGKSNTYYHHQLSLQEDQGIDMTQSPGRDSPGSSGSGSRHSTASLDSGRASSCHLSGHTRSSVSSSSVSSDHSASIPAKVERLLLQGVPDQDVLHSWLMDIRFEEYFPLFVAAGYDMHTISRMTPEDLTAIGIKKPNHRKKLKAEIAQLNISDGLPEFIPGSLEEWLHLLRLNEYGPALGCQGYTSIDDVTQLTWEDLEDIGIVRLGHQKKILLAIKRIKDLKAGKVFSSSASNYASNIIQTQVSIESPSPSSSGVADCECPPIHTTYHSFHQPWEIETSRHLYFATDLVPIKIRGARGKSLESLEESMNSGGGIGLVGGTSSFTTNGPDFPPSPCSGGGWRRSYDDADITPTNETMPLHGGGGGGTLPRPRGLVKPRLIAKVPAQSFYRNEDISSTGTLKRFPPPSPPKRTPSECGAPHPTSGVTTAELHHSPAPPPPPAPQSHHERHLLGNHGNHSCLTGSQEGSFVSSGSSTESDSLPFANENAGTIKTRSGRNVSDYAVSNVSSTTVQSSLRSLLF
ncbi:hypothetical protein WDU94_007275 [Cyamophila willieti]